MNYERIYAHRFAAVSPQSKQSAWSEIAAWLYEAMGRPRAILDPAAGELEFLRNVPAAERWGVDLQKPSRTEGVHFIQGDIFSTPLPAGHFEGAFLSNFLEHLDGPERIVALMGKLRTCLAPGGRLAIMGPNFKYCAAEYFDCADHLTILTHVSVGELLAASGFRVTRCVPRFLPYSFRSRLPSAAPLVRAYLRMPWAWPLFGKQFLLIAEPA
jgi:SAM-dependent methyltransferase